MLLQRRAYTTRLLVLQAWRLLVHRSKSLLLLHMRVGSRLTSAVLAAWRHVASEQRRVAGEVEARAAFADEQKVLMALSFWRSWAETAFTRREVLMRFSSQAAEDEENGAEGDQATTATTASPKLPAKSQYSQGTDRS